MKILIVGMGFIGQYLAVHFLKENHTVDGIDKDNRDHNFIHPLKDYHNFTFKRTFKNDENIFLDENNQRYDVIIYTAAMSNAREFAINYCPEYVYTMMNGPSDIIGSLYTDEKPHFIYLSSSMVYGNFGESNPNEETYCAPIEPYGITKLASEGILKHKAKSYNIPLSIVRPSAVYGFGDGIAGIQRVIETFVSTAKDGGVLTVKGNNRLDFTYIDDIVDGIDLIVKNKEAATDQTFNITGGNPRSLLDAAAIAVRTYGGEIDIQDHDELYPVRGGLDITKARDLLGYNPRFTLEKGIEAYAKSID